MVGGFRYGETNRLGLTWPEWFARAGLKPCHSVTAQWSPVLDQHESAFVAWRAGQDPATFSEPNRTTVAMSTHVEVHVNGYAAELCNGVVEIFELGSRRLIDTGRFEDGRVLGLSLARDLGNEHGTDYQNHMAIEEHLRFAVENSGVE